LDEESEVVVEFFYAIGVACVNAFTIYGSIYDEDVKQGRIGLPRKWTNTEFLQELVFDLLLPEQWEMHVRFIDRNKNNSMASSVAQSRLNSFSVKASKIAERYDLSCVSGRKTYLQTRNPHYITKDWMMSGYFKDRLDGLKHHWCHALRSATCQYCVYVWTHEFDKRQKRDFAYKQQNKYKIIRCLTCNVHLCSDCDMEFHIYSPPTLD